MERDALLGMIPATDMGGDSYYINVDNGPSKQHGGKTGGPMMCDRFRVRQITFKPEHGGTLKFFKGIAFVLLALIPFFGWFYLFLSVTLIEEGKVGLAMNNGHPELLRPGWHFLLSGLRSLKKQESLKNELIKHGTITIVTIREGFIGLALDKGTPILLGPGMHQWESETMEYYQSFDMSKHVTRVGPYTFVLVNDGQVAVTNDNGKLDIKSAGFHVLKHERHIYNGDLDITDQFDELNSLELITSDNVPVSVDCTVHYKIEDSYKAALNAGHMEEVRKLVMREARSTMASAVLQSTVSDLELLSENVESGGVGSRDAVMEFSSSEQKYRGKDHQAKRAYFLAKAQTALANIGVKLFKIAIRKMMILDSEITKRLAQQASIRVTRMESLDTADVAKQTTEIEALARSNALITIAKAEAEKIKILADAKLYEAKKIQEAAQIYGSNKVAHVLAELQAVSEVIGRANTNTIFVGGGNGGITSALLSNPQILDLDRSDSRPAQRDSVTPAVFNTTVGADA